MPKRSTPTADTFVPHSLEDVFALYLSRELRDVERVRFYARLTSLHSMCLLLNALRRARADKAQDQVEPPDFLDALNALVQEDPLL